MINLKIELHKLIDAEVQQINEFIGKKKSELIETSHELEFAASLKAVQTHVKKLQGDNAASKETNNLLKMELDDLKQYTRMPNLRLYGVRNEKGESSGKVFKIVENVCKEVCPEMFKFGCLIDRAHRIGKTETDGNGVTTQAIIRFTTFRDRTAIYRARKDIKNKLKYGISLDLIPSKLTLLSEAKKLIDGVEGIHFVYNDINCYTRAFLKNGQHNHSFRTSRYYN